MQHPSCSRLVLCVLLGFVTLTSLQRKTRAGDEVSPNLRTWTDATGRYKTKGALVDVKDGIVRIKKEGGAILSVPVDKLSANDIDFLRSRSDSHQNRLPSTTGITSADELEKLANKERTAEKALTLYNLFLKDPAVPKGQKALASHRLPHWKNAAKNQMIRVGRKWYLPSELAVMKEKECALLEEAIALVKVGDIEPALERVSEASRANPDSIRPDFFLGIVHAILARDSKTAERHFTRCVQRRLPRKDELTRTEQANLVSSLNNLALIQTRHRRYSGAIRYWRLALELSPNTPEVWQNIGRLYSLSRQGTARVGDPRLAVRLTGDQRRQVEQLYIDRVKKTGSAVFDSTTGWLYMPYVPEARPRLPEGSPPSNAEFRVDKDAMAGEAGTNMQLVASGTGFVVYPQYILTNAHVAADADAFLIAGGKGNTGRLPARVVAISKRKDLDLALLHCEKLAAPPVQFSSVRPRLGADLRLLGFPLASIIGTSLKVTSGIVCSLPPHAGMAEAIEEYKDYYLYDATINPGNSGGPACDINGHVIAVNTAILMPQAIGGGYAAGVTAEQAEAFLKEHLLGYRPNSIKGARTATWEDAVSTVAESTVCILVFQSSDQLSLGDRFREQRARKGGWLPYEDPWCMACHGRGHLECPVPGCANGGVRAYRQEARRSPDGIILMRRIPIRVRCKVCGGRGRVQCSSCVGGIDPVFVQ